MPPPPPRKLPRREIGAQVAAWFEGFHPTSELAVPATVCFYHLALCHAAAAAVPGPTGDPSGLAGARGLESPDVLVALLHAQAERLCFDCQQRGPRDAVHAAVGAGHVACVRALIRRSPSAVDAPAARAEGKTPLMFAVLAADARMARALLSMGAAPEATCCLGGTALHVAAAEKGARMPSLARLLVEDFGAELDVADSNGMTPLLHAALHGNAETLRCLLSLGADATHVDHQGNNAFHHAVTFGGAADVATVLRMLHEEGVDVVAENGLGQTPYAMAHDGVRPLLRRYGAAGWAGTTAAGEVESVDGGSDSDGASFPSPSRDGSSDAWSPGDSERE